MVLLHADPDSEDWQCYLQYLDDMVVEGLFSYISRSLHFLVENMEAGLNQTPLFEAKLILNGSKMTFCPSMEKDAGDSLYELIEGLVADVFKTSVNIRRVAAHLSMETYQVRCFMFELAQVSYTLTKTRRCLLCFYCKSHTFRIAQFE